MARRGERGQHSLPLAIGAPASSRAEVSLDMLPLDLGRYPHQRRTEKTGQKLCRQARSLRRDADLRPPRPAKARWKGVYHSLDRDVLREKGDARLVQIEGFDPEKVAILKPVLRSSA